MSKKITLEEAVITSTVVLYDREALSIMEDKEGWHLVRIPYSTETQEVGKLEVVKSSRDHYEIMNEFETRVEQEIL